MVRHAYLLVFVLLAVTLACGGPEPTPTATPIPTPTPTPTATPTATPTPPPILWTRQFGSPAYDLVQGAGVDGVGNVYVVGYTDGALPGQTNLGVADAFVRKYGPDGTELWTRQFGSPTDDYASGARVDRAGNVYVVGRTAGALPGQTNLGGQDAFVRKYGPDGTEVWTSQFGSASNDAALGGGVDRAGNVYVVGSTEGALPGQTTLGGKDAFVRKYGPDGTELWTRQFGSRAYDGAQGVVVSWAGNVYVVGFTNGATQPRTKNVAT